MNHLKLNNPEMKLYVASMGKLFRVTAIARTDAEANQHTQVNQNEGVIAQDKSGLIYIANIYGTKVPSTILDSHHV